MGRVGVGLARFIAKLVRDQFVNVTAKCEEINGGINVPIVRPED